MKLSEIFAEFKNIRPDPHYAEKSKRAILASPQFVLPRQFSGRARGITIFFHSLETGIALVLAGFFIMLATGSFSGSGSFAPVQYSVIDPQGLHAEAQAIDIQIQLAALNYAVVTSSVSESTTAVSGGSGAGTPAMFMSAALKKSGTGTAGAATSSSPTSTNTLSVDEALGALSQ